jgi:hypothetical protein
VEKVTARQRAFLKFKMNWPYPSSAKAARLAGYSESVARKADRIIRRGSPTLSAILEKWEESWRLPRVNLIHKREDKNPK